MGGLTAVAAAGAALAAGTSTHLPITQPELVAGTLTYTWHGDPARGCAAQGLCGSHGALIVQFDGYGQLFLASHGGNADLQSASATVRVRRDDPSVQPGECVDALIVLDFGIRLNRVRGRRYTGSFSQAPASSGRCAGPLVRDLAGLRLPAVQFGNRGLGFDLRGRAPFVAGPFSGELSSTVVLRPDLSQPGSSTGSSSSGSFGSPPPPPPPQTILIEYARLRYRVTGATGALQTAFAGDPEPLCEPLDSCGTNGQIAVTVGGYDSRFALSFSRRVSRRVGASRALADLRAGRLANDGLGLNATTRAAVSENVTRTGGGACRDAIALGLPLHIGSAWLSVPGGPIFASFGGSGALVVVGPGGGVPIAGGVDPLRTHCGGPSTEDVSGSPSPLGPGFGGAGPNLAFGSIPLSALGSPGAVLTLGYPGSFSASGYSGTRSGSLQFTLTLVGIATGTQVVRVR